MKLIQRGPLGQAIANMFGLKGGVSPMLDEQIVGTYEPSKIESSPWRLPEGFATGTLLRTSLVGEYSYVGVQPANARQIVVVRQIIVPNVTGGAITWLVGFKRPAHTLNNVATLIPMPMHRPMAGASCQSFSATQVAGQHTSVIGYFRQATNALDFWEPPVPMACSTAPGWPFDAITVRSAAQNQQLIAGFIGDVYELP
jgi:hypothetical protein